MRRFVTATLLAVCVAGGLSAAAQQPPQAPQPPSFRGLGESVRVFATVTDKDGRLVPNLQQEVFEVRDEGKPQPITLFDNTPQPIRLIVMLDVSGSMIGNLGLLRAGAEQLFTHLGRDDMVRVGTFGEDVTISEPFTNSSALLKVALPTAIDPNAPTPLWRAIEEAMDGFGEKTDTRRVILVLSDGKDSGPIGFSRKFYSQGQVIDRARNEDVMIYAVGMRSRAGPRPMPGLGTAGLQAAIMADMPDPGLAMVAEQTGGGYIEIRPGQDLGTAFVDVAAELHSQYLIGFTPPKRDGKVHEIEVKVSTKGMKPRARKSYVAPKDQK